MDAPNALCDDLSSNSSKHGECLWGEGAPTHSIPCGQSKPSRRPAQSCGTWSGIKSSRAAWKYHTPSNDGSAPVRNTRTYVCHQGNSEPRSARQPQLRCLRLRRQRPQATSQQPWAAPRHVTLDTSVTTVIIAQNLGHHWRCPCQCGGLGQSDHLRIPFERTPKCEVRSVLAINQPTSGQN